MVDSPGVECVFFEDLSQLWPLLPVELFVLFDEVDSLVNDEPVFQIVAGLQNPVQHHEPRSHRVPQRVTTRHQLVVHSEVHSEKRVFLVRCYNVNELAKKKTPLSRRRLPEICCFSRSLNKKTLSSCSDKGLQTSVSFLDSPNSKSPHCGQNSV